MTPPPWPWPQDSREDRAKRVALSYRHLAETHPDLTAALTVLDDRWTKYGAGWVRPTPTPLRLDDWLTATEMADLFHQAPATVREWGRRGNIRAHPGADGTRRYNVGDVVAYQRTRRLRRTR